MNKIFKLVANDKEKAIIEVMANDPLTVAMHPYVNGKYKYITVTKGESHVITIIKADSTTFSYSFGRNGHTLVCDNLETLREKVMEFLENEGIMMNAKISDTDKPLKVSIFYNPNFRCWQIVYRFSNKQEQMFFCKEYKNNDIASRDMAIDVANSKFKLQICKIERGTCATGIPIWYATNIKVRV